MFLGWTVQPGGQVKDRLRDDVMLAGIKMVATDGEVGHLEQHAGKVV